MPNRHEIKEIPADKARQGEIILKSRTRRIVFIAGLVGLVVLGLIVGFVA